MKKWVMCALLAMSSMAWADGVENEHGVQIAKMGESFFDYDCHYHRVMYSHGSDDLKRLLIIQKGNEYESRLADDFLSNRLKGLIGQENIKHIVDLRHNGSYLNKREDGYYAMEKSNVVVELDKNGVLKDVMMEDDSVYHYPLSVDNNIDFKKECKLKNLLSY